MVRYYPCIGLLMLASIATFISSCKKEIKAKSKTELLVSGSWKLNALSIDPAYDYNGDGTPETDLFATFEDCSKDDYTTFSIDGTAISHSGDMKCDPNEAATSKMTWSLNEDETKLTINGMQYNLVELNTIQLRVSTIQEEEGVTYTQTAVMVH